MKKAEVFWIKYIDYFDNKQPGDQTHTYSSPKFEDIYEFYCTITSDKVESIGYTVTNVSESFTRRIEQIKYL